MSTSTDIDHYITACRARIPQFVRRHFSLRGSLQLHRQSLGLDILRTPLNITWNGVYLILAVLTWICAKCGWFSPRHLLQKLPHGVATTADRQLQQHILKELLQHPQSQSSHLQTLLEEYAATRGGTADFTNNALMAITSKFAFGHTFFGALSAGAVVASIIATHWAINNFWLGNTLGKLYYSIIPVQTPLALSVGATLVFVLFLAVTATLIGVLTDPIQVKLGLHQRRLHRLIDAVEARLTNPDSTTPGMPEKFMGRSFDIADLVALVRGQF